MSTSYTKFDFDGNWKNSFENILSELISKGEVDIPEGLSLQDYACKDGFFRVQGKIVLAYIRDQQHSRRETNKIYNTTYKYHLLNCKHLREFNQKNYIEKYVLRSPSYLGEKGDSTFNVNILDGGKLIEDGLNEELLVCKFCLSESNFKDYSNLRNRAEKDKFVINFNYKEFFESEKIIVRDLWSLNLIDESISEINAYPPNWIFLSKKIKDNNNYRCKLCSLNCKSHKHLLHLHHKNGRKNDNNISNLVPLCVDCHSKQRGHEFMREEYLNKIMDCEKFRKTQHLS